MKFFRQTKETKRKLSFFLALAMVVSLLPVSPVAKATEQETAFKTSIEGAYVSDVKEYADNTITTGAAIVTLKVSDDAKKGKTIEQLGVTSTNELVSNVTTAVISVSHSAIGVNLDVQSEYNKKEVTVGDNGEFQVIVKNITESDKTITITGSWKTEGTNTPSTKPTNPNEPSKPSEPTPTPVTVTGTVSGSAAGIKEVSVDVPSGQGNVDNVTNNLGKANYYTKSDGTKYKETDVRDALKNSSNIKTSLVLSESEDEVQTKAVSDVKKNKNNIENLSSAVDQASFDKMVDEGVVLDIDLTSYIMQGNTTIASIKMSNLKNAVTVKMDIPESLKKYAKEDGHYYVIRIHEDGKITIIECKTLEGNKISFESDKFSTYIVTFKKGVSIVDKPATDPTPTPTGSGNGNNNGYIPGPGQSPAPSSSAAPSSTPSSAPSGTPGTNPTNAPGNPSGAPTDPTNAPSDPTNAPSDPTKAPADPTKAPGTSTSVKVGKKATISGSQYKVTSVTGTRTVQFTKGKKNAKKIVIPSTVKVSGKNYKVTAIAKNALKGNKKLTKLTIGANVKKIGANAFKGCSKLKNIVVKTKKLTKSKVGSNAFKGINAKATIKVPKAKVKAYKKIVKAKGAGKNVKVKK